MDTYEKRGYLDSDFKLFYLTDSSSEEPEYHYHEFNKIILFLKGRIGYSIEGRYYDLQPNDIVLVNENHIHKPFIDNNVPYERIIIYISRQFMSSYKTDHYDLSYCLKKAKDDASYVIRMPKSANHDLWESTKKLISSFNDTSYAHELSQQICVLEFMLLLNRASLAEDIDYVSTTSQNPTVLSIMEYINTHLDTELTIDIIANTFYISKYNMMRTFKKETGYTILDYITMKRMILAKQLIMEGASLTSIAFDCGYNSYSSFYRCYKKFYNCQPNFNR